MGSEENIRNGTSYKYFFSELLLFACMCLAAPHRFLDGWVGRVALALHLPLHVGLVAGDYFNHEAIVQKALFRFDTHPVGWLSSKL